MSFMLFNIIKCHLVLNQNAVGEEVLTTTDEIEEKGTFMYNELNV